MTTSFAAGLPLGFEVSIRGDVQRPGDGRVLVGGSPLRAITLTDGALELMDRDSVRVVDRRSGVLAQRLLDANVADPVLATMTATDSITVVIPVRDRPEQLDRALAALHPLHTLVVDDGSTHPEAVAEVIARHGARLIRLPVNVGPAGARNAGLATVTTPYVAFVDSDVQVTAKGLMRLARHFDDPRVALVGPRVVSVARSVRPRWHERYDEHASSLDLGGRACSVRPGAAVGWLPSACVVGRVQLLAGGFDEKLRIGEDVDLVWRLVAAGHTVRYDPTVVARHDTRPTLAGWLGRKFAYGTGGAVLAQRHGDHDVRGDAVEGDQQRRQHHKESDAGSPGPDLLRHRQHVLNRENADHDDRDDDGQTHPAAATFPVVVAKAGLDRGVEAQPGETFAQLPCIRAGANFLVTGRVFLQGFVQRHVIASPVVLAFRRLLACPIGLVVGRCHDVLGSTSLIDTHWV